ncbi:cytochrome P450 [Aspergillus desertorum]
MRLLAFLFLLPLLFLTRYLKYGPVVRIAPDHYSINDRAALKTIYGSGSRFAKSAWYEGWKHPDPQSWMLFPDTDIKRHGETRKRFSSLYSMSSLLNYEEFVDQCADVFFDRLGEFAERDVKFNLGEWFQFYAFDVIGEITYGERFGFLDRGHDIDGTIGALQNLMTYSSLIGVYHECTRGRAYIMRYVQDKIARHSTQKPQSDAEHGPLKTQTFLEKMMLARDKDPEKVTDYHVFMMGLSNVIAGSDTTAISLSTIMYHLLHSPNVLDRLRHEIDEFTAQGKCSDRVTFKESQEMPYFKAVMKEALRMHSATGLPFWRVVPAGGAEIAGYFFPEGTVVGINAWVPHHDETVFEDAETFRPERWLEAQKADSEKLKVMNEMYMPFGLGSRTCIGKHISIPEMSKLIPRILREFDSTTEKKK